MGTLVYSGCFWVTDDVGMLVLNVKVGNGGANIFSFLVGMYVHFQGSLVFRY